MKKLKKNLDMEFGRAEAWGLGVAVVFTEGLVVALGPWYLELNW